MGVLVVKLRKLTIGRTSKNHFYVDTHCNLPNILKNLGVPSFRDYQSAYLSTCDTTCEAFVSVASDSGTRPQTLELINIEKSIFGSFGIHPLYAKEYTPIAEAEIMEAVQHPKTVAWGEIGLDYHDFGPKYNYAKPDLQKKNIYFTNATCHKF